MIGVFLTCELNFISITSIDLQQKHLTQTVEFFRAKKEIPDKNPQVLKQTAEPY